MSPAIPSNRAPSRRIGAIYRKSKAGRAQEHDKEEHA